MPHLRRLSLSLQHAPNNKAAVLPHTSWSIASLRGWALAQPERQLGLQGDALCRYCRGLEALLCLPNDCAKMIEDLRKEGVFLDGGGISDYWCGGLLLSGTIESNIVVCPNAVHSSS